MGNEEINPTGSHQPSLWTYVMVSVVVSVVIGLAIGVLTFESSSDMAVRLFFLALLGVILGIGEHAIFSKAREKG